MDSIREGEQMSNIVALNDIRQETFAVSPETLIGSVVKKEDFAIINGKIEPTRDLALKLFAVTKIDDYTCELQQVVNTEKETVYIVKATVSRQGKKAEGLGACSTAEIEGRKRGDSRSHHDALATAETRAYKRALEAVVGLPFINEIILKLFGGYETPSGQKKETQSITPDELIQKIKEAKAMAHLKNIWQKYSANIMTYSTADAERVRQVKEQKKKELGG
jgi:hypothetical protein